MLSAGSTELALPAGQPPPVVTLDDRTRLSSIAEAHYDFVWRTLRRLGLPPSAADDATQQVFMVVARRLADIPDGAEKAFLYRSAAFVARESRRKHAQRREHGADEVVEATPDSAPGPEEIADRKRARALLDEALDALDDELREVFVLFEIDGMQVAELATLLEIPQGTVASRLRRAREHFMAAVKRIRAREKKS